MLEIGLRRPKPSMTYSFKRWKRPRCKCENRCRKSTSSVFCARQNLPRLANSSRWPGRKIHLWRTTLRNLSRQCRRWKKNSDTCKKCEECPLKRTKRVVRPRMRSFWEESRKALREQLLSTVVYAMKRAENSNFSASSKIIKPKKTKLFRAKHSTTASIRPIRQTQLSSQMKMSFKIRISLYNIGSHNCSPVWPCESERSYLISLRRQNVKYRFLGKFKP